MLYNGRLAKGILVVMALLCALMSHARQPDTLAQLDAILKNMSNAAPGGVLTITRNGEYIYNKALGLSSLEYDIKNTPETIFEAGSVSKQFTATAVLLLVEEGKLSLEDDVRKYIPELPSYGAPITLRHLLTHTSGLKDWGEIAALGGWPRGSRTYTQAHALAIICRQATLNFEPGTQYSYSNSNYTLCSILVERLSGQSLADFTQARLFDRIGMSHTSWRDNFREVVKNRAQAYNTVNKKYVLTMPFENTYGHAALLTTTADLLKWNNYWAAGRFGEQLGKMRVTRGVLKNGQQIGYACGAVVVSAHNGITEVNHSGATAGYRAWLAWYPEKNISVAFLCNDGSVAPVSIGRQVAAVLFGPVKPQAADSSKTAGTDKKASFDTASLQLAEYTGTFYSRECEATVQVVVKDKALHLFYQPAEYEKLSPAYSKDNRTGFYTRDKTLVEFIKDSRHKVTGFAASIARATNIQFIKQ